MAFFSLQRSDSSVCIRDDKWWSSAYLKTYRSKLVRLPTNVFGHCHHLVNDGLDLLLKIKKKLLSIAFMATMPQSGKKYSEKKISYVVVQKAIAVRIVQPKHNWKKGENTELLHCVQIAGNM